MSNSMDNDKAYRLLMKSPAQLLATDLFQQSIRKVVKKLVWKGMIKNEDQNDVVQELNVLFLQKKMHEIQKNYRPEFGGLIPYFEMAIYRKTLDIARSEGKSRAIFERKEILIESNASTLSSVENEEILAGELEKLNLYFQLFYDKKPRLILLTKLYARICLVDLDLYNYYSKIKGPMVKKLLSIFGIPYYEMLDKEVYHEIQPVVQLAEQKQITSDALRKWVNDRVKEMITALSAGKYRYDKESIRNLMLFYHAPDKKKEPIL